MTRQRFHLLQPWLDRIAGSAVAWSFVSTGLRLGGAVLILPIVLRYLPPEQLGLWYVFVSIGSVVALMDAGFGLTLVRSLGYLWAGVSTLLPQGLAAKVESEGEVRGPNFKLMADLIVTMDWYYRMIALMILIVLLGPGTLWMWYKTASLADAGGVRGAWLLFSVGTAVNMAAAIWSGVLLGINNVRASEQIFARALLFNYVIVGGGLWCGFGLWAMVAGQLAQGMAIRLGGKFKFTHLAGEGYRAERGQRSPELIKTLWPMSWRSAAMGLGSYLILFANTLVCSSFLGLAETGSYGLTFQLVTVVAGVSAIWVNVKLPVMNQMRTAGDTAALAQLFISRLRLCLGTYVLGAVALVLIGPTFLHLLRSKTSMLAPVQTATLLLVMFLTTLQSLHTSLVLSENRNPFVMPMLATGIGIGLMSVFLAPRIGVWGLVISFGLGQLAFLNWWSVMQGLKSLRLSPSEFFRRLVFGGETA